jgi:predicted PolB exonuclease-like 3'-5' exonuclease
LNPGAAACGPGLAAPSLKLRPSISNPAIDMPSSVIVWDIETVPDLRGFAAANALMGRSDDEVRAEMGEKFPKLIFHSIVCIGALIAHRQNDHWAVSALGAPNVGERSENEIISAFVNRVAELAPQLVTFNGAAFDLPVLRYRAMVCGVAAPGLAARPYFNRYTEDAIDLCDVLSSFSSQNKASLHELCRVMGLPGKPDGIGGADVERYCREGRIAEVAAYCETDVVNTYRVWLRYELFRGRLTENGLRASEANLSEYLRSHRDAKPHLGQLLLEKEKNASGPVGRPEFQSEGDGLIFTPDTPGV